jgi:hypothetical protein
VLIGDDHLSEFPAETALQALLEPASAILVNVHVTVAFGAAL